MPWTADNFPVLNERALAHQAVFDEALAPKYDCLPATPPALQYDPYMMEVVQWPDRVMFRYEKDDQLRTVWLDGRQPTVGAWGVQGMSTGLYEENALLVETTHYTFDVTGFDDYNGIPSSQQKRVLERYWREGDNLKVTVTVEDPLFLREPASYTTQWIPAPAGYKLQQYDCDPVEARHPVRFLIRGTSERRGTEDKSMRVLLWIAAAIAMSLLATDSPTIAHHASAAFYDGNQSVEIQGSVTKFVFREPAFVPLR